jgi:hypothetical protein
MWTPDEEQAFARLMQAGRIERLPAIRLYRRCNGDLTRALAVAVADAPTDTEIARRKAFGDAVRLRAATQRGRRAA